MGTDMATIDEEQVAELLGRFVNDLGATISAGNVPIGDKLGLYQTLAEAGPLAPSELAEYALSVDGVWLIVEPYAGGSVAENLTPVGRIYYSFSTFLCVPHVISEGADNAVGNQAGETAIADVVEAAGFRTFRRVAETPFNLVYEARP